MFEPEQTTDGEDGENRGEQPVDLEEAMKQADKNCVTVEKTLSQPVQGNSFRSNDLIQFGPIFYMLHY